MECLTFCGKMVKIMGEFCKFAWGYATEFLLKKNDDSQH